jgi:thiamine-monophosphate kinase
MGDLVERKRRSVTTVHKDNEGDLIARITKGFAVPGLNLKQREVRPRGSIGDDCSVIRSAGKKDWVVSCDFFLEGVHFLPRGLTPPEAVGYKALARATSDLAAMGAQPRYFLLALALPGQRTGRWLDQFLVGLRRATQELGMVLIGGDTTEKREVAISITVIGDVRRGREVYRSGASSGDLIYVSGTLGRAGLGLELMLRGLGNQKGVRKLLRSHLYPSVRTELGMWLAQHRVASAMMDLSDGLSSDLPRLCAASRVGAKVCADWVPQVKIPDGVRKLRGMARISGQDLALDGGEDYELLFCVPPAQTSKLRAAPGFSRIRQIGEIRSGHDVVIVGKGGERRELLAKGWDPFRRGPSKPDRYLG